MKNYTNHIISSKATLKDGLIALTKMINEVLYLFVVDKNQRLIGILTDGDIRRALISGILLTDIITAAMKKDFYYVKNDEITPNQIKNYRSKSIKILPCIDDAGKIIKVYDLVAKKSILPIDVVLMAGGKGLRLRPLTETTPKPLLKVGDKAIIDYNVERLINYGVENIHVNVNYLAEQIENHFRKEKNGINITCIREPKYLGTIGSVKFIKNFHHDMVLVMNSDLFTNINFEEFYNHHIELDADISVAAIPYSVSLPYGIFELDELNIKGLREKPTFNYYANGGIYLVKRKLFDLIPDDTFFDATEFIELLISQKYKVVYFPHVGYWIDIGKPEDYKKVQEFAHYITT
jgi:dTDP-glucose pyrophosphorylase